MSVGEQTWADDAADIACCPEHGLHGGRNRCFVCKGHVEWVTMVPVHRVAVAWRALERARDRWIGHALNAGAQSGELRNELKGATDALEVAEGALCGIAPWRLTPSELDRRNIALQRVRVALGQAPVQIVAVDSSLPPFDGGPPLLNPKDLLVDVQRGTREAPIKVMFTHVPTGLSATATRQGELHARVMAMQTLRVMVHEHTKASL